MLFYCVNLSIHANNLGEEINNAKSHRKRAIASGESTPKAK